MSPILLALIIYSLISPLIAGRGGGSFGRHGGGHSYPSSSGLSGSRINPGHSYPHSTGMSGNRANPSHSYPHSTGLSGNQYNRANPHAAGPSGNVHTSHTSVHRTEVHHYHYSPPQHISYGSTHHPVFHGTPPVYVYEYRQSGSKFDNLLTGLALYNLGRMSANHDHYNYNRNYQQDYRGHQGETCKLAISKSNGEYEETRIDCKLMSSFIWDFEREQKKATANVITKTVNVSQSVTTIGNSTVTIQNTTVVDALQVKGPSIKVTPEMSCFMIRISRDYSTLKKKVECGLLQEYATRSLNYNRCSHIDPVIFIFLSILITFLT